MTLPPYTASENNNGIKEKRSLKPLCFVDIFGAHMDENIVDCFEFRRRYFHTRIMRIDLGLPVHLYTFCSNLDGFLWLCLAFKTVHLEENDMFAGQWHIRPDTRKLNCWSWANNSVHNLQQPGQPGAKSLGNGSMFPTETSTKCPILCRISSNELRSWRSSWVDNGSVAQSGLAPKRYNSLNYWWRRPLRNIRPDMVHVSGMTWLWFQAVPKLSRFRERPRWSFHYLPCYRLISANPIWSNLHMWAWCLNLQSAMCLIIYINERNPCDYRFFLQCTPLNACI